MNDADNDFLDKMIPQHEESIGMAKDAVKEGRNADVNRMAGDIVSGHGAQLEEMKKKQAEMKKKA